MYNACLCSIANSQFLEAKLVLKQAAERGRSMGHNVVVTFQSSYLLNTSIQGDWNSLSVGRKPCKCRTKCTQEREVQLPCIVALILIVLLILLSHMLPEHGTVLNSASVFAFIYCSSSDDWS